MINFEKMRRPQNNIQKYIEDESVSDDSKPLIKKSSRSVDVLNVSSLSERDEEFNPEIELQKIRRMPRGDEKELALVEFKKLLSEQRAGITQLSHDVQSVLQKLLVYPDREDQIFIEARDMIEKQSQLYKLPSEVNQEIKDMLSAFADKHHSVAETIRKYPDPRKLFKFLYGSAPEGKIELRQGVISLSFICYDIHDYAKIYKGGFRGKVDSSDIEVSGKTGGVFLGGAPYFSSHLRGTLIGVNFSTPSYAETTLIHEEQHAMNRILRNTLSQRYFEVSLYDASNTLEALSLVKNRCRREVLEATQRAKDEIVAYLFDGSSVDRTINKLISSDLYRYFDKESILENIEKGLEYSSASLNNNLILEEARKIFEDEYVTLIKEGAHSFRELRWKGYSSQAIAGILMPLELWRWRKIADSLPSKIPLPVSATQPLSDFNALSDLYEKMKQEEKRSIHT